ncbi:MAG: tetratricopeptide repeat protein [Anaerolineae bacterium]|nr:tetratricopeptide repeat protein [Anaerolineae bacterium]
MLKALFGLGKNDLFNQALNEFRKLHNLQDDNGSFIITAIEVIRLCQLAIHKSNSDGDAHVLMANAYYLAAMTIPGEGHTYCLPRAAAVIYQWKTNRLYTKNLANGEKIYQSVLEAIEHPIPGWATNMSFGDDMRGMHSRLYHEAINPDCIVELKKILTATHPVPTEKTINDNAETHILLGTLYGKEGRLDESIRELQTALQLEPNNSEAHFALGISYGGQERWNEAIQELQTALWLDPNNTAVHIPLANAYLRADLLDKAIQEFQVSLRLFPDNIGVRFLLGRSYQKQGYFEKAIREYQNLLELDPNNAITYFTLGELFANQGQLDKAIRELHAGLYIAPNNSDAHLLLGWSYAQQGYKDKALRELQIAVQLGSAEAQEMLTQIEKDEEDLIPF